MGCTVGGCDPVGSGCGSTIEVVELERMSVNGRVEPWFKSHELASGLVGFKRR